MRGDFGCSILATYLFLPLGFETSQKYPSTLRIQDQTTLKIQPANAWPPRRHSCHILFRGGSPAAISSSILILRLVSIYKGRTRGSMPHRLRWKGFHSPHRRAC